MFSDNTITMNCETTGAEIYYRTRNSGAYTLYTEPLEITQDTIIQAYSKLGNNTSENVTQTFIYDDGIEEPLITCDGEYVEINCSTSGASIYYRIGTTGQFQEYESPFEIESTVTVYAYAIIDQSQSETVSQECTYVPVTLALCSSHTCRTYNQMR